MQKGWLQEWDASYRNADIAATAREAGMPNGDAAAIAEAVAAAVFAETESSESD